MVKKGKTESAKTGSKAKKGTKFVCDSCGMVITSAKECGCDPCDIVCCGQEMKVMSCC